MYVCVSYVCLVPTEVREGFVGSPGLGVTEYGMLPCGGWESITPGSLETQPVL